MRNTRMLIVIAASLVLSLVATAQGTDPLASELLGVPAAPATYRIGDGDLLAIYTARMEDFSRLVRVDAQGDIELPLVRKPIAVAGETSLTAAQSVAGELKREGLAVWPEVTISVQQVESKPVIITGAVQSPRVIQAIQPLSLVQAIAQAHGVASNAGNEVLVTRTGAGGQVTLAIPLQKVLGSADPRYNPMLVGGEIVRVLNGGSIYVVGAATQPGGYPLTQTDHMTVTKAVSLSRGWIASAAPDHAKLYHYSASGIRTETTVNLPKIIAHREPDLAMQTNDVLYIPDSTGRKVLLQTITSTAQFLSYAAAWLIVR